MKKSELKLDILKNSLNTLKECYKDYSSEKDARIKDYIKDSCIKRFEYTQPRKRYELQLRFNESLIPYVVNFSDFSRMDKEFFKLIEPDLIPVNPTP